MNRRQMTITLGRTKVRLVTYASGTVRVKATDLDGDAIREIEMAALALRLLEAAFVEIGQPTKLRLKAVRHLDDHGVAP